MTTQELISLSLGDGATPDEEALLSRALVSDPAVSREFVDAARIEGALRAQVLGPEDQAELAATLDAAGIAGSSPLSSRGRLMSAGGRGVAAAAGLLLAAGAWWLWLRSADPSGPGRSGAPERRPPPRMASGPGAPAPEATPPLPSRRDALAARASRFYLPNLEWADQPLDKVLEHLLAEVAAANHLERPELSGFELAWQPLNVASASSPPRVTLRQSHLPLATALEWLGALTDCTVQWHERGARLVESLPESEGARLQKIAALRDATAPPPVSLTARLVELPTPQEIAIQVVEPEPYRQISTSLASHAGTQMVALPSVQSSPGEPFQIELTREVPAAAGSTSDWAGLRVNGHAWLSGEVIRVAASVRLRVPGAVAGGAPSLTVLRDPAPPAAPLREDTTDLEALIPAGHTVLLPLTEAGDDRCLSLHLTAERDAPASATNTGTTAGQ